MSELQSLPELKFETRLSPNADRGKQGDLEWISIDKLFIDQTYQRDMAWAGKANIRRIVENFHWSMFSPLVVTPRGNGKYAVIDGQHRATAARLHGTIKSLPCLVVHCAGPAEEAMAFAVINGNISRLASQFLFRARLAAGEKRAVIANRAAEAAGVRIMPYPLGRAEIKPGQTLASGTIERLVEIHGEECVTEALLIIVKAAGNKGGLLGANIIEAVSRALFENPRWRSRVTACADLLAARGIQKLTDQARQRASNGGNPQKAILCTLVASLFEESLGKGRTEEKPPPRLTQAPKPKRVVVEADRPERSQSRTMGGSRFTFDKRTSPTSSPKKATDAEKNAIADFIAKKGVRKVEQSATGDRYHLLSWLQRRGIKIEFVGNWKGHLFWRLDDKTKLDAEKFDRLVDTERAKDGLPPLRRKAA